MAQILAKISKSVINHEDYLLQFTLGPSGKSLSLALSSAIWESHLVLKAWISLFFLTFLQNWVLAQEEKHLTVSYISLFKVDKDWRKSNWKNCTHVATHVNYQERYQRTTSSWGKRQLKGMCIFFCLGFCNCLSRIKKRIYFAVNTNLFLKQGSLNSRNNTV